MVVYIFLLHCFCCWQGVKESQTRNGKKIMCVYVLHDMLPCYLVKREPNNTKVILIAINHSLLL